MTFVSFHGQRAQNRISVDIKQPIGRNAALALFNRKLVVTGISPLLEAHFIGARQKLYFWHAVFLAGLLSLLISATAAAQSDTTETFGDWNYGCNDEGRCFVLMNGAGARVIFAKDTEADRLFASVVVPAQSGMDQPVTVRLNNNVAMQLNVNNCTDRFCEAVIDQTKSRLVVDYFRVATDGVVAYLNGDKISVVPISMAGFSDAIARLGL